jgi:hypothetical protein
MPRGDHGAGYGIGVHAANRFQKRQLVFLFPILVKPLEMRDGTKSQADSIARLQLVQRIFIGIVCAVLILTAMLKLLSLRSDARVMDAADPILGIKNRYLMWFAALFELYIAGILLIGRRPQAKLKLISATGFTFSAYRVGLAVVGFKGYCACLGEFADNIPVKASTLSLGLWLFVMFMLLGGLSLLWLNMKMLKVTSAFGLRRSAT